MNVGWLIDADMFDGYRDQLVAAIREQGHDAKLIHAPSPPFRWDDVGCSYRETFAEDACVISHGDIELVTRIHNERRWTPGAFCTVENFLLLQLRLPIRPIPAQSRLHHAAVWRSWSAMPAIQFGQLQKVLEDGSFTIQVIQLGLHIDRFVLDRGLAV